MSTGTPRHEPIIFSKAFFASRTDMLFTTEFHGDPPPEYRQNGSLRQAVSVGARRAAARGFRGRGDGSTTARY